MLLLGPIVSYLFSSFFVLQIRKRGGEVLPPALPGGPVAVPPGQVGPPQDCRPVPVRDRRAPPPAHPQAVPALPRPSHNRLKTLKVIRKKKYA